VCRCVPATSSGWAAHGNRTNLRTVNDGCILTDHWR
jgi:hypothetical protein